MRERGPHSLDDVMRDGVKGAGGIAASAADISPSMCMLCILQLANEHELAVWTDAHATVFVRVDGE